MPRYAKNTEVTVERTRAEIEETVRRYKATEFQFGWKSDAQMIAFRIDNLFVRFILPIPKQSERRFTHKKDRYGEKKRTDNQAVAAWDQEIRQRWRGLLLNIKGKLEAVEIGITTVVEEFLAHVVLPNDQSMGEWLIGEALPMIRAGQMPQLGFKPQNAPQAGNVTDAEFEVKP